MGTHKLESLRAISVIDSTSADYFSFFILEAFLWLHLGVKLGYFSKPVSRRMTYEYGNRLLGAYERTVAATMLQKFSPPLQRILEAELTGRVELFSSSEEMPVSSDEILYAFQSTVVLVAGFANEPNTQQFLKMVNIAKPMAWEKTYGNRPTTLVPGSHGESEVPDSMWSRVGLSKVVEFMEAYRQMQGDYDKLPATVAPQEGPGHPGRAGRTTRGRPFGSRFGSHLVKFAAQRVTLGSTCLTPTRAA